ncbi:type II/IV secretion system protein, partial [Candidatus Microgenomates bacterium]
MDLDKDTLRSILVDSGGVPAEAYNDAAQSAEELGKEIGDVLIFRGLINQAKLSKLIAAYYKVSLAELKHFKIPDELIALVPEKMARTYFLVPLEREVNTLKVAMTNPANVEAIEFVKRHTGMNVVPSYAPIEEIRIALSQYKQNIREEFDQVIAENLRATNVEGNLQAAAEKLPVIKVLDTIFQYALAERASDIHIESLEEEVFVRFRIDGVLHDIIRLPKSVEEALLARIKILSNLKLDEHRVPQDGRYKFTQNEEVVSLRISIIPGFYGENVVMRLLRESARPQSLEELGILGKNQEIVNDNLQKPHGMILVTGPTGSGKTTTLYSMLNIINTIKVKICTIEDPIEYAVHRVTQIQINQKTGLTFAAGLRALLRHDPDVIMVGEIRDSETAEIAVHSALTGHLVLSTLHTNDAPGTIPRILDMGVEGYLASSTINVVIAQRLVRKICSSCKMEYAPSAVEMERLGNDFGVKNNITKLYKGKGCTECRNSGFSGRIGIYEVLPVTEAIRELVNKKSSTDAIRDKAVEEGMKLMIEDGLEKVEAGMTTIEEVLRV